MSNSRQIKRISVLISVFLLCVLIINQSNAQVHSIEKSYVVGPGGTLRMNIAAGNIIVRGWEYDEVQIQADVHGSARALDNLELRFEQDRDDVIVRTERGQRRTFRGWRSGRSERIDFTIYVPFDYNIRINLAAGRVDVDDIDGSVRVQTSAGSTHISNIYGPIDVNTSAGSINVSLLDNPDRVSLSTSTGSISIVVPEEINARFSLNTSIGRVRCSLANFSGSGSTVHFSYNEGGELVDARTSVGSIRVNSK